MPACAVNRFYRGAFTKESKHQHGAEIVDVGVSRPWHQQVAGGGEQGVGVVAVEHGAGAQPGGAGAGEGVGRDPGAGVVFAAVDAVGVSGQRPDARLAVEGQRQGEQKLGAAPALAGRAAFGHGHGRLTAGEDDAGLGERRAVTRHAAGQRRMRQRDVARFAFHVVGQDVRGQTRLRASLCHGLQHLPRGGDEFDAVAAEHGVARLGRLQRAAQQPGADARGNVDAVTLDDFQRLRAGGGIGHGGAAGDGGGIVAGHIRNQQREHLSGGAGGGEPSALDGREVLAHAVHFANGGTAHQQFAVDALFVGQAQPLGGQRQQRRAAAGDEADDEIIGGETAGERQHAPRGRFPCGVGHGVRRFDQFDAARLAAQRRRHIPVARRDEPGNRRVLRPQRIQRLDHGAAGLARADHQGAALGRRRQKRRHDAARLRAGHGHVEQGTQKRDGLGGGAGQGHGAVAAVVSGVRRNGVVAHQLDGAAQRGVIEPVHAIGGAGRHELLRHSRVGQRHAELLRTRQRQVQIFLVQVDAKARLESALDHALAVHFENARRRKAAHQRLTHLGRIGPGLAGEQQRLGHGLDVERDDDLVGHLAGLPVAIAADQSDVLAHEFEQGLDLVEHLLLAAHHDGQARGLGAHFAAGNRRIEILAAQRVDSAGKVLGFHRADGAHVHHDLARRQSLGHAIVGEQHLLHIGRVGHHGENDVGLLRHFGIAGARLRARVEQGLRHFAAGVDVQRMPARQQMARHGRAHDAQSDESQCCHVDLRFVVNVCLFYSAASQPSPAVVVVLGLYSQPMWPV